MASSLIILRILLCLCLSILQTAITFVTKSSTSQAQAPIASEESGGTCADKQEEEYSSAQVTSRNSCSCLTASAASRSLAPACLSPPPFSCKGCPCSARPEFYSLHLTCYHLETNTSFRDACQTFQSIPAVGAVASQFPSQEKNYEDCKHVASAHCQATNAINQTVHIEQRHREGALTGQQMPPISRSLPITTRPTGLAVRGQ